MQAQQAERNNPDQQSSAQPSKPPSRKLFMRASPTLHWFWGALSILLIVTGVLITLVLHLDQQRKNEATLMRTPNLTPAQQDELIGKLEQQQPSFFLKLAGDLVLEFGIALLVAYFVASTVEKAASDRATVEHANRLEEMTVRHDNWVREIRDNVFQSLLGTVIPEKLLFEVRRGVLNCRFVRRNLELGYVFSPTNALALDHGGANKMLLMQATITYELENIAGESESVAIHHYYEDLIKTDSQHGRFTAFEIVNIETATPILHLDQDQLSQPPPAGPEYHSSPDTPRFQFTQRGVQRGIEIPSIVIPGRKAFRVSYTYVTPRRYCDSETYFVTQPAYDGIKISVAVDTSISEEISFQPDTAHRLEKLQVIADSPNLKQWNLNAALLPGQGVVIFWSPNARKKEERSGQAQMAQPQT